MSYVVLYPEERVVSESRMRLWCLDAIANEEIQGPDTLTTDELANQLEDAGAITIARNNPPTCEFCGRQDCDCSLRIEERELDEMVLESDTRSLYGLGIE